MNLIPRLAAASLFLTLSLAQEPKPADSKPTEPAPVGKPTETEPAPKADAKKQAKVLELGARIDGEIALQDIDGATVRARELMGKVTVVNFYSIQCPVQAQWDARLAEIQRDYQEQGVVFLHVDSNVTEIGAVAPKVEGEAKPYDEIRQHLAEKKLPFRVLVDHGNKVADLFAATSTPHVYVFGTDGKLVYKGLVDDDQRDAKKDTRKNHLRDLLGKLVKGEAVEPSSTNEVGCSIKRVEGSGNGGRSRRPRGEGRRGERRGERDGG